MSGGNFASGEGCRFWQRCEEYLYVSVFLSQNPVGECQMLIGRKGEQGNLGLIRSNKR